MSIDISAAGGWGSGSLGDVTFSSGQINSYFNPTKHSELSDNQVWLDTNSQHYSNGIYHDLLKNSVVGTEVLIVGFQTLGSTSNNLGNWSVAKINAVEVDTDHAVFTFDKSLADVKGWGVDVQFITIPHFKNFTIPAGKSLSPPAPAPNADGDAKRHFGGYVAFKCSGTFTLNGNIDLRNKGFADGTTTYYRPTTSQESYVLDTDMYSGCENSITKDHLLLNVGDGACWILAQSIVTSSDSRIGNPALQGVQYCRGASDSFNLPTGATNIGGSTIFIATRTWSGFKPAVISKYRSSSSATGRGLARAFIAARNAYNNQDIKPDEGLYALDVTHDPERPKNSFKLSGFGKGSLGARSFTSADSIKNLTFNSYAPITSIENNQLVTDGYLETDYDTALADFTDGTLVMIHQSLKQSANDPNDGKFVITRLEDPRYTINYSNFDFDKYYYQIIAIPEFTNLTLSVDYNHTPPWSNGAGGICAIACSGTCNLSGGKINVEGKGTFNNVKNEIRSNYLMKSTLPIGQGHGSVFILANTLTMNDSTRIGATYDGSNFGGKAVDYAISANTPGTYTPQGGWRGTDGTPPANEDYWNYYGTGGHGGAGGINPSDNLNGGWHSNGNNPYHFRSDGIDHYFSAQGAHVMIIANTINNFTLKAISTGGNCGGIGGGTYSNINQALGDSGGAGYGGAGFSRIISGNGQWSYGGAGGYRGGGAGTHGGNDCTGGGGSGAAFIYCNNFSMLNPFGIVTF